MKKLLFVLCGFFILSAFNMFNEEQLKELDDLKSGIQEAKQDQDDIEEDLCFAAGDGDEETFFDLYYDSPKKAKTICVISGRNIPLISVAARYTDNNKEILRELIFSGKGIVEMRDDNGFTPLMWAAIGGQIENVKYLVNVGGANINAKNNYGKNVLSQANDPEIIAFLKQKGAIDTDKEATYKKLLAQLDSLTLYRGSPDDYDYETVKKLMGEIRELGYQIPTKFFYKYRDSGEVIYATKNNAVNYSSENDPFPTILFASLSCLPKADAIETLLKQGANPNQTNNKGETPLIAFFRYGYNNLNSDACMNWPENRQEVIKVIKTLLRYNANINAMDNKMCTVLDYALATSNCPRANYRDNARDAKPARSPQDIINLLTANGAK